MNCFFGKQGGRVDARRDIAKRADAVGRAGAKAFRDSMSTQPARQRILGVRLFSIRQPANQLLPAHFRTSDTGDKKFNCRLVAPIYLQGKHYGVDLYRGRGQRRTAASYFGFLITYLTLEMKPLPNGRFTIPFLIPPIFSMAFWDRMLFSPT
jgi:hypothetical protein